MSTMFHVPFGAPGVEAFRRVPYSRGPRRVAWGLVVFFVLLAVVLAFVPWQQTAYGRGAVVAYTPADRPQAVEAPVAGRIEEWFVREGSLVEAGDPIARIVDVDPDLLPRLENQREAARAKVRAAEMKVETARKNVRRQAKLETRGLSARRQVEEAQMRVADAEQALAAARADLLQLETRLARQVQIVHAPMAGTVFRLLEALGGTFVKQGDELVRIAPADVEPAVELWIDGNELPLVRAGAEVRLHFEGWPAIQLSGWPAIAVGTFGGRVQVIDAAARGPSGKFRMLVRPGPEDRWPPSPTPLRQGVLAQGWVLLDRVPLGYELWRRFNDFPPTPPPFEEDLSPKREDKTAVPQLKPAASPKAPE